MSSPLTQPNLAANGNVTPCRFVVMDSSAPGTGIQATGSTLPLLGVSAERTRYPVGSPANDGYCAIAPEPLPYHGPFQIVNLELGTGGCTVGDLLTSDSNGKGVTANLGTASTIEWVGAMALKTGVAGDKVPVFILSPTFLKTA